MNRDCPLCREDLAKPQAEKRRSFHSRNAFGMSFAPRILLKNIPRQCQFDPFSPCMAEGCGGYAGRLGKAEAFKFETQFGQAKVLYHAP